MMLHLVCDTSGSMGEGGKPFTMRTVVMAVAQWVNLGYGAAGIRLCGWGAELRDFSHWNINDEFPTELLSCGGTSNWDALIQLVGERPDGKVLLLSDGFWPQVGETLFRRWRERVPPGAFRIIKIGADANPRLTGPDVFSAEEFFAALDGFLEGRRA
jgi:hypothetical protein